MRKLIVSIAGVILILGLVVFFSVRLFARQENVVPQIEKIKESVDAEVAKTEKDQTVKVFFNNDLFDPGLMDCSKVYPVNRTIKSTVAVARAALEELLKGLAEGESELGYLTNLNTGIKIQKLTIENGTAYVDFSEALQASVGGSCKTTAIRSQITQTLKQFPTVKDVVISIDGNIEDILQP